MRISWRTCALIVLVGSWPNLGCHQLPGDKSVKDLSPIQDTGLTAKKQELTVAEITQTWIARADKLEKEGKSGEAIALCEKMREQPGSPQAVQATRKLALLYDRRDDRDRAEQEYRLLLQQNPKDADALAKLGNLYNRKGQWGLAYKCLSDATFIKADNTAAWSDLGMALAQLGDYDKSLEAFAKVLSSRAEAYCEVAFLLKMQGKPGDAVRAYEAALKIEPNMRRATVELAQLRQTDGPAIANQPLQKVGQKAVVETETAPTHAGAGTGRQMMRLPTLPPLNIDLSEQASSNKK